MFVKDKFGGGTIIIGLKGSLIGSMWVSNLRIMMAGRLKTRNVRNTRPRMLREALIRAWEVD